MKNNKGFGKYEILTMIVILMGLFSFFGYKILKGVDNQKFTTMKKSGVAFSNAVATNISTFHYTNVVYLKEAVDEGIFPEIKNPFGKGYCDSTQSRVDTIDGNTYTTLKCGEYLIEKASFNDAKSIDIYKVSEWSPNKPTGNDVEERELYNCTDNGEEVFERYQDEFLFVYEYNKANGTDYYFAKDIKSESCEVVSKTHYRTREKAN